MSRVRPGSPPIGRSASAAAALIFAASLLAAPATVRADLGECSQPVSAGASPKASDCLYILQVAVGSRSCDPACMCAPLGELPVRAADALACLKNAVGQEVALACPCPNIFAPLGEPIPSASPEQLATFERGREVATRRFTDATGLGPKFNVVSCASCHEKPVIGGAAAHYRDFLLVRHTDGATSTNTGVNGVQPIYVLGPAARNPTDLSTNLEALRSPIPFFGVGLIAEISEEEILSREDPDDADGDGISGRANYEGEVVGRFGRKSQTASIEGFIRGPLFNHGGITTDPLPPERKAELPVPPPEALLLSSHHDDSLLRSLLARLSDALVAKAFAQASSGETPTTDTDGVPDPELGEDDLFDLVSFAMLLAAPKPDFVTPEIAAAKVLFAELGCADCHVPAVTGPRGDLPVYSDFLLHDMGPELADGIKMGLSTGSEFRTHPLWGIAAVGPYLHDGRADTLDDAIRAHGGEAEASRDAYVASSPEGRESIVALLLSLGGASQASEGLLPPGTPVAGVGSFGGPAGELTPEEEEAFFEGRRLFDRDIPIAEGMGPLFNGDSCRACHFDPVIGGAGPDDVNVIRHGYFESGVFTPPAQGTIAHRISTQPMRPPVDPEANVFEARQTPPIFGLGFLESIPEEAILANENCDDPDPNAISGCAHFLEGGALGRLGWKADVPSLAEFSRDAMSNELGVTVPANPERSFGAVADGDAAADPEIDEDALALLTFFMQALAAPPGQSADAGLESEGEELFGEIGCASCHVEDFATETGVVAYTDLLLHDVAPEGKAGIASGSATHREFRTPPLWGLSHTAPYMHDGRAFTVEAAIARHESEGAASRQAFDALSDQEKEAVLAFLASL